MIRIGMNTLLWTDQFRIEEHRGQLLKLKKWGFDGVELVADQLLPEEVPDIAVLLREAVP